jgi:hypothetical protein
MEIDISQTTPADYTICVKNVPIGPNRDYRDELYNIFTNYAVPQKLLVVTKVVLVYNIDEIIEKEEELKEIIKEK